MMALFPVFLLVAVTLHSSTSLTAKTCRGTLFLNGSVEFRIYPQGKRCSYDWVHNGIVLAYDGVGGGHELVEAHAADFLILKTLHENISYKEDCQDEGICAIPCICNCSILDSVVHHPNDNGRHNYLVFVPFLLLILSGAVLGFLCKEKLNLCRRTTRLTAGEKDIV